MEVWRKTLKGVKLKGFLAFLVELVGKVLRGVVLLLVVAQCADQESKWDVDVKLFVVVQME